MGRMRLPRFIVFVVLPRPGRELGAEGGLGSTALVFEEFMAFRDVSMGVCGKGIKAKKMGHEAGDFLQQNKLYSKEQLSDFRC